MPTPTRLTFTQAIRAFVHCTSASLRHPGFACFRSSLAGMGTPSLVNGDASWNPRGRSDRTRGVFHVAPFSPNPTASRGPDATNEHQTTLRLAARFDGEASPVPVRKSPCFEARSASWGKPRCLNPDTHSLGSRLGLPGIPSSSANYQKPQAGEHATLSPGWRPVVLPFFSASKTTQHPCRTPLASCPGFLGRMDAKPRFASIRSQLIGGILPPA
ncbi:MAG: hypothetical protein RLZZ622_1555, partial [Planctomycetota bacterium]